MRVLKYIYYRETEQRNTGSLPSEKERRREELVKADKAEETMRERSESYLASYQWKWR